MCVCVCMYVCVYIYIYNYIYKILSWPKVHWGFSITLYEKPKHWLTQYIMYIVLKVILFYFFGVKHL